MMLDLEKIRVVRRKKVINFEALFAEITGNTTPKII